MATTFRGTSASFPINGNDLVAQNLFAIENAKSSRVNVIIKRLTVQNDPVAALAAVMPLVKTSRATGVSGGINLDKCALDTALTSSAGVTVRAAIASGSPLTATPGNALCEQYVSRMHTVVEQVLAPDVHCLPKLVENATDGFVLAPGEALLVRVEGAAVTSNAAIANNWFAQVAWEEESIATFAISGTVTLSGSPVDGAKVYVLEASNELAANAVLVEVLTTNALGQWSSTIKSGCVGVALVQYKNGATYYTAPGSPFLES